IFPAAVLAGLERRYLGGSSIAPYFDLIAGTSTGGIIALGLGAGHRARDILKLYVEGGDKVFPPFRAAPIGRLRAWLRGIKQFTRYIYDREALRALLAEPLKERLFGESAVRLCIPAFEAKHSEVFVYKTPHHPDY